MIGFGAGALVMPSWGVAGGICLGAAVILGLVIPIFMLDGVILA